MVINIIGYQPCPTFYSQWLGNVDILEVTQVIRAHSLLVQIKCDIVLKHLTVITGPKLQTVLCAVNKGIMKIHVSSWTLFRYWNWKANTFCFEIINVSMFELFLRIHFNIVLLALWRHNTSQAKSKRLMTFGVLSIYNDRPPELCVEIDWRFQFRSITVFTIY